MKRISKRLQREREQSDRAARDPAFKKRLAGIRARLGKGWDPKSVLARRVGALVLAEEFLLDLSRAHAKLGEPPPEDLQVFYFGSTRDFLAVCHDPAFAKLTWAEAREDLKPKAGPQGAAGLIARWSVRVSAFNDGGADWRVVARRFRSASTDVRRRSVRTRAR